MDDIIERSSQQWIQYLVKLVDNVSFQYNHFLYISLEMDKIDLIYLRDRLNIYLNIETLDFFITNIIAIITIPKQVSQLCLRMNHQLNTLVLSIQLKTFEFDAKRSVIDLINMLISNYT